MMKQKLKNQLKKDKKFIIHQTRDPSHEMRITSLKQTKINHKT